MLNVRQYRRRVGMVISFRSGVVTSLSPTTVILALAHSRCLMSGRAPGGNEMSGNEGGSGEKGGDTLGPRKSNRLAAGVLETP